MDKTIMQRTLKEAEEVLERTSKAHDEALLTVMRLRLLADAWFLQTGDKSVLKVTQTEAGDAIR